MKDEILDVLVESGCITDYSYENVSKNGEVGVESEFRNTERLFLYFSNKKVLKIETSCSGISEDTFLHFEIRNAAIDA